MGLLAHIYRDSLGDSSNRGISSRATRVVVVNVDGPFTPDDDTPAVELRQGALGSVVAVPLECEGKWTMNGGCFVSTSDSRFSRKVEELLGTRFYGAVPLHDRVEG